MCPESSNDSSSPRDELATSSDRAWTMTGHRSHLSPAPRKMSRAFLAGISLLLCGGLSARSNREPLVFVFLRVDREQDVAILRPMIAPDIGVQVDSGPRER